MTESEKVKVITLRKQGASYGSISQQLGLNLNTVKSFCKRCKESGFTPITDRVYCKNCGVSIKQTPHRKKSNFAATSAVMYGGTSISTRLSVRRFMR